MSVTAHVVAAQPPVRDSTGGVVSTVIASKAAVVPFSAGLPLRLAIPGPGWLARVIRVLRYAERVRRDPSQSTA